MPQAFLRGFQDFPQGLVFRDGGKEGGHAGSDRIHGLAKFPAVAQAFQDISLAHAFRKEVIAFLQRSERIFIRHFFRTEAADFLYGCPGVAVPSVITAENGIVFRENLLFTHRGLSGPAVLQISSYWQPGEFVSINLLPDVDLETFLNEQRNVHPNQSLKNTLAVHLPKRLVERLQQLGQIPDVSLKQLNVRDQQALISTLTDWRVQPNGTEGYRTAEVTLGGVDTNELSSRTMEARKVPGLYFIGEVMDVTGWLGGYNFQWAWSSAWACAQDLIAAKSS